MAGYFTCNHLIINSDGLATLCAVAVGQCFDEVLVKVSAKIVHEAVGIVLKHEHLPTMRLAHAMTLKAILIATCLLAHLAIPSQLCESFGFDAVANGLRGEESATLFCLSHWTLSELHCRVSRSFRAAFVPRQSRAELLMREFDVDARRRGVQYRWICKRARSCILE
jgi:hypothetical protein